MRKEVQQLLQDTNWYGVGEGSNNLTLIADVLVEGNLDKEYVTLFGDTLIEDYLVALAANFNIEVELLIAIEDTNIPLAPLEIWLLPDGKKIHRKEGN